MYGCCLLLGNFIFSWNEIFKGLLQEAMKLSVQSSSSSGVVVILSLRRETGVGVERDGEKGRGWRSTTRRGQSQCSKPVPVLVTVVVFLRARPRTRPL